MSGDEYMDLLVKRREEFYAEQGQPAAGFPAMLDWFVQPGDEELVDLPPQAPQPKRETTPRRFTTAAELTEQRDRLLAERDRVFASAGVPDRAAAGGEALGRKRTARQAARSDAALRRYVELDNRISALNNRIALARSRERP